MTNEELKYKLFGTGTKDGLKEWQDDFCKMCIENPEWFYEHYNLIDHNDFTSTDVRAIICLLKDRCFNHMEFPSYDGIIIDFATGNDSITTKEYREEYLRYLQGKELSSDKIAEMQETFEYRYVFNLFVGLLQSAKYITDIGFTSVTKFKKELSNACDIAKELIYASKPILMEGKTDDWS